MIKDRSELEWSHLPTHNGKLAMLWIARYDAVKHFLRSQQTNDANRLFSLGVVRLCTSCTPDGRQIRVQPVIDRLANQHLELEDVLG